MSRADVFFSGDRRGGSWHGVLLRAFFAAVLCSTAVPSAAQVSAGPAMEPAQVAPEADQVLRTMADFLAETRVFRVTFDVDQEIVTIQGQKLQFSSSGEVVAQRPGRMRARRQSGSGAVDIFIDGETITIAADDGQEYLQIEGDGTIDGAIDAVRSTTDLDLPGADLIYATVYEGLMTDVSGGIHLGTAFVNGHLCEHLAYRAGKVDWQIWIKSGPQPLPLKYVITSTWVTGAPQYTIRLRDWDLAVAPVDGEFTFVPPEGSRGVEHLAVNALGDLVRGENGRCADSD